ncbi:DNA-processing protein DprA [Nocardia sp. CS682]|uniref:DNA-processing protein DprA n=1 Tax=Nocardia sp. CS682 TaxID=1047172 RepID=UPI001074C60E|nr:DNA-processing protein DprA [Nocardia sp. CS682]QBS44935.1 DNA-protecting protein DprA [Nocardia sp. CS682]
MSADARRRAWALLSRAASGPSRPIQALITQLGVEQAADAVVAGDVPVAVDRRVLERGSSFDAAARDLDRLHQLGGRLITPDDDEWPAYLLHMFRSTCDDPEFVAPVGLWARGPVSLHVATDRAIAVVGARASTEYGNHVATEVARDLAARGWAIVSGAAFGIDGVAHRAALAADAATIAVLACGVDRAYPTAHARLLEQIAESGLILSEYPLGMAPSRDQFLARNRLTVGLSDAVIAVEAGLRSGSINSVRWANRLHRPAFAMPGPVTSAASAGCHRVIADGRARLTTCADDVIAALAARPSWTDRSTVGAGPLTTERGIR